MNLTPQEEELLRGIMIDGNMIGDTISPNTVSTIPKQGSQIEEIFNLEPGSTEPEETRLTLQKINPVTPESYDEKDAEVDTMFQQIYDVALNAYADMTNQMADLEPKFRSRSGEVAASFLNTALAAATQKANQKKNKDAAKIAAQKPTGGQSTTIINVGDLIKQMSEQNGPPTKSLNRPNIVVEEIDDEPPARKMKTS